MPALSIPTKAPSVPARPRAELILNEIDALPTFPAIAARLIALTSNDDSSAREVVQIISQDPALTASILKFACRSDKGIRTGHLTLQQAVTLLGFKAVRNAVLSVQIHAALPLNEDNEEAAALRREMWRHAVATACVAEELAPVVLGARDHGDAFVAGLLHDMGKLALDAGFPKSYARVAERVEKRRQNVCDAEHEVFGLDHTVAGKRLATRWNLPTAVVESVWLHHMDPTALPSAVQNAKLVALVHLADGLVRRLQVGFSGYRGGNDLDETARRFGVTPERLQEAAIHLPDRLAGLNELLGLDDADARHLFAESLQKANRELGAINAELHDANRRLAVRSLFFDVMNSFQSSIGPHAEAADVCRLAALSLATAGKVKNAVVLMTDAQSEFACLGIASGVKSACRLTPKDEKLNSALSELRAGPNGLDVDSVLLGMWRTLTNDMIVPRYAAAIAIHDGKETVGAVLLPSDESMPQAGAAEWCALTDTFRLAAARAFAQRDAERHQEELYELTRRLQSTQRELVRSRTISMIAEMSAGAAHEINNPLSVISGRAQLLRADCPNADWAKALDIIVEKTTEASQIVSELMNFAKPAAPQAIQQPLLPMLEVLCQRWRTQFELSAEQLSLSLADDQCAVHADAGHLAEMLDAVVSNAVQASEGRPARVIINSPSTASDETVRIEVQDNGAGMSPEVAERAIDPFFSHRAAGRGRGLGLSRAYRLAGVNGGHLWIDSSPNIGTTVTIELPSRPMTTPNTQMSNS